MMMKQTLLAVLAAAWGAGAFAQVPVAIENFIRAEILDGKWKFPEAKAPILKGEWKPPVVRQAAATK